MMARLLFLSLLLLPQWAMADFMIEIIGGVPDATPIAVAPFGGPALDDNPGVIIANDLRNSGLFKPLPDSALPAHPISAGEVFFHDWLNIGADYLVVGNVTQNNLGLYEMRYDLLNLATSTRLQGEALTLPATQWRDAAHQIADRIYQRITGVRGAFATRLLYVNKYFNEQGKLRFRLEIADSDGHRPVNVLDSPEPIISPAWSPDGERIAYVSFESGRPAIYVQTLRSRSREKIASFPGINGAPAWSPDGSQLALTLSKDGNPEIYLMDLRSHALTRLTDDDAIDTEPRWFPDGQSLIFTSDRGGTPQLYRLDVGSRAVKRLTFSGNYNARADISPDGGKIAFVHREKGQQFQIAVQDLSTGELNTLTSSVLDESPSFAPNGSLLVYATHRENTSILSLVSPDGRVKEQLPARHGEVREPAWSPFLH